MRNVTAVLVVALMAVSFSSEADTLTWDGSDNPWNTAASWGGTIPNLATPLDQAIVNGGNITWTTVLDFAVNSTFTMNGGSWIQVGVGNWIDIGIGGKTGIFSLGSGAVFDTGSAGNFFLGRGAGLGFMTINGGTLIVTNNAGAELHVQGGVIDLNGGLIDASLVSFDGSSNSFINLNSGELRIAKGNVFQGIFSSAGGHVNFITGSDASIFIDNLTTATMGGLLTSGKIRYNNAATTNLVAVDEGTGIRITLGDVPGVIDPVDLSATLFGNLFTVLLTDVTIGTTNHIDVTTNLTSDEWTTLLTFVAEGTETFYADVATNSAAFYRVVTE
jgi:hypothetical protein